MAEETKPQETVPQEEPVVKVALRHPHTGDVVEVENTGEALTPWMVKGYIQHRAEQPKGE